LAIVLATGASFLSDGQAKARTQILKTFRRLTRRVLTMSGSGLLRTSR
jgi:hypothetical protein